MPSDIELNVLASLSSALKTAGECVARLHELKRDRSAPTTVIFPPSERFYVDALYGPFDWDSANEAARLIMDALASADEGSETTGGHS